MKTAVHHAGARAGARNWRTDAAAVLGVALIAVLGPEGWRRLAAGASAETCVLLLGAIILLSAIPWLVSAVRWRVDVFEPSIVVSVIIVLSYVLPGFALIGGEGAAWLRWGAGRARGEVVPLLAQALAVTAAAVACFMVGYYVRPWRAVTGRRVDDPPALADAGRNADTAYRLGAAPLGFWSVAIVVGALASLAIFVALVGGTGALLSGLNDRIRLFSGLNYFLFPVTALLSVALVHFERHLRDGRRIGITILAAIALAFTVNSVHGSKTNILAALIAFVVARHYLRARVRLPTALLVAVLGVVLAVGYDLYFREFLVIRALSSIDLSLSAGEIIRLGWLAFSSNAFVQLPSLMLMIDGMPEILPFQLGRPYLALLLMPVPRSIFPGKPPVGTEIFSQAFYPDMLATGTSIPTSLIGEFYMNFGVPGVLLGALVAGVVARLAYDWVLRRKGRPGVVVFYGAFVGALFPWMRGDTFGPTIFFLTLVVPIVVLVRLGRDRLPLGVRS